MVVIAPGAVVLVPVVPAAGAVFAVPSPKPVPGALVGLAPPKSPPKAGAAVADVLAGAAEEVAVVVSVFGAKKFNPVVAGAVVDVAVDPVPIEGAAVVPVSVAFAPGGFKLPKIFDPLVVPVLGATVVGLASNRPPDGVVVVVAGIDRQGGLASA